MLVLKHLFDWSYDGLEREVRANLVYRAFTRIDADEVSDAKTILKIARVLGPDAIHQLHQRVVDVPKRAGVTHGRRFRIDTTVVETNVHDPPTAPCCGMAWGVDAHDAGGQHGARGSTCSGPESHAQRDPPGHRAPGAIAEDP
jgi:hypothetical protein